MTMEPKYIELPQKKVVGMGTKFVSILSPQKNNAQVLPALWQGFIGRLGEIKNRVGEATFGLCEMLPELAGKAHKDEMFYIAGTEVADFNSVPKGMIQRVVPAGRYACFTHKGRLDRLEQTMKEIYLAWLPKSKLQLRDAPHLELDDQRFAHDSDKSEFDILLPVR
jgi:AraC family transcriptional regulator